MDRNVFDELRKKAVSATDGCRFRVVLPREHEYDAAREISNSYFDKRPAAVAFPRNARQVQECLQFCIDHDQPFRLRSGGHQHEGMSSLDDGLMIRLSDMCLIEVEDSSTGEDGRVPTAWIDPGIKLGQVYSELRRQGMIIPGGGCFTVNVGGLTQGGGWGMHARKHGLTCDSVLAIEIVLFDHSTKSTRIEVVSSENQGDLFRALRGGGGGNFGVVTRFKFRLTKIARNLTSFRFGWRADKAETVMRAWLDVQTRFPNELTSFVRLGVMEQGAPSGEDPRAASFPVYGGGLFYGTEKALKELPAMEELLVRADPEAREFESQGQLLGARAEGADEGLTLTELFGYDDFASFDLAQGGFAFNSTKPKGDCDVAPPSVNCDGPHPHKVSSAFPKGQGDAFEKKLAAAIATYLDESEFDHNVRSYMTIHAMGGAISREPEGGRAFPYKNKEFLLQFQSWWNYPDDKRCFDEVKARESRYIEWVREFRQTLDRQGLVEGAFINFVDQDLPVDSQDPNERRKQLLEYYYADELPFLMGVKKAVDPEDWFRFAMSIPPA